MPPFHALTHLFFFLLLAFLDVPAAAAETPLPALTENQSVNGVLTVTLEAKEQTVDLGDVSFKGMVFNGDYAGPLLRAHPGDTLRIHLINHLPEPTNLHFHGLHTSPLGHGDNVLILAPPGGTLDYEVKISPHQPPGLFWYHTHPHGLTDQQVNRGLSGALLIDGFAAQFMALRHVPEKILTLKQYEVAHTDDPALKNLHKTAQTINGQLFSTVSMGKGETQLWHIGNHSADSWFHLALQGHKFRIIGRDGVAAKSETVTDHLDIGPANRFEILVDAGDQAGIFDLISERSPIGTGSDQKPDRVLAQLVVQDKTGLQVGPLSTFPAQMDLRQAKIDKERLLTFTEDPDADTFSINNQIFDHNRLDTRVPLGSTEAWTIKNDTNDRHIFHIHQMHYQLVEINGEPQPFDGYIDTVRVPEKGAIKIIIPFTDPVIVGRFVYHCHVLEHEDKGMMANIEVYDPAKESVLSSLWESLWPKAQSAGRLCGQKTKGFWQTIRG